MRLSDYQRDKENPCKFTAPDGTMLFARQGQSLADLLAEMDANRAQPDPPPSYRELRAAAYRDELGKEPGDFLKTIGDTLDVLIAEMMARQSPETEAMRELAEKVAAIKERYPKDAGT